MAKPLHIHPHTNLVGKKFGVRFMNHKRTIYVPPEIFVLAQDEDPQLLIRGESLILKDFFIKEFASEDDEANPLKGSQCLP